MELTRALSSGPKPAPLQWPKQSKLNLSKIRLTGSRAKRADLINRLAVSSGPVVEQMKTFVENDLGNPDLNAQQIGDRWEALCRELTRIHKLRPQLEQVARVADLIEQSGGNKWAERSSESTVAGDTDDPLLPGGWQRELAVVADLRVPAPHRRS